MCFLFSLLLLCVSQCAVDHFCSLGEKCFRLPDVCGFTVHGQKDWNTKITFAKEHLTHALCAVQCLLIFLWLYPCSVCVCVSLCVSVLCCLFKYSSQCRVLFLEVKASKWRHDAISSRHKLQPCARLSIAPRSTHTQLLSIPRGALSTIWALRTLWNLWHLVSA